MRRNLVPTRRCLLSMMLILHSCCVLLFSTHARHENWAALTSAAARSAGFCQLPWNPISAILISTSICVRWTMVGHHVSHGGYNAQVRALG
jgi:hypothetical protein